MKTMKLQGVARDAFGKKNVKSLRSKGLVPCNLYGNGSNVNFSIEDKSLQPLLNTPNAYLVEFDIDGKKEKGALREVQYHPVSDNVLHVDFFRIDESKPLSIAVPVELRGSAEGVKVGGKLQQVTRKIVISALPKDLPDSVAVDISQLGLGKSIFVGDIQVDKATVVTPKSTVLCAVKMTRAAMGAAAASASTGAGASSADGKAKDKKKK